MENKTTQSYLKEIGKLIKDFENCKDAAIKEQIKQNIILKSNSSQAQSH